MTLLYWLQVAAVSSTVEKGVRQFQKPQSRMSGLASISRLYGRQQVIQPSNTTHSS